MLAFLRKTGPLNIHHTYYSNHIPITDIFKLAVYYQAELSHKPFGFISKPFYTIVNNLELPVESIFKGFTSTVRNEVRRSERENVQFGFIDDHNEFYKFQNDFATAKKTYMADLALIEGYKRHLLITCATFEKKTLAAHAYLPDLETKKVRLLFSSNIRFTDTIDLNFIGRANKLLHFKDMIYFKGLGYQIYDFGGFAYKTEDKQRNGINVFKQSFGGELVENKDYQSWLYWLSSKLFYKISNIKNKFLNFGFQE